MATKKFDREEAVKLRLRGYTYPEISVELGCSVAWCKKELANIVPGSDKTDPGRQAVKKEALEILQEALAQIRRL